MRTSALDYAERWEEARRARDEQETEITKRQEEVAALRDSARTRIQALRLEADAQLAELREELDASEARVAELETPPLQRHLGYRKMRGAPDLRALTLAYKRVFPENSVDAEYVLRDLMTLANADGTTYVDGDPNRSILNEGMRNLWLHIEFHLNLDPDKLNVPETAQMESSDE